MADKPAIRERLKQDLEKRYEKLLAVIDDAMVKQKQQRVEVTCRHCLKSSVHRVDVLDVKSALAAAQFISDQSLGRPGVADDAEAPVTHNYVFEMVVPCKHEECQPTNEGEVQRDQDTEEPPRRRRGRQIKANDRRRAELAGAAAEVEDLEVNEDELSVDGPTPPRPRNPASLVDEQTYDAELRAMRKRQQQR
jgi:hypothetical protein